MKLKSTILLVAALLPLGLQAQSFFTFSKSTATYTDIDPVGATNLISNFNDVSASYPLPAGFKMFNQLQGGTLTVGRDGWTSAQTITRFFAYDPFMIIGMKPYVARSQTSAISARTDVTGQDTIVKVQWKNITIQDHPVGDHLNFQLWLYKKTQVVEFRYGPSVITPGPSDSFDVVMVHFNDDFSTCYESQQVYGSGTSVQIENNPDSLRLYNGAVPDGTVFRFSNHVASGITNVTENTGAKVYPNPTTGIITIEATAASAYTVCNMAGMVLMQGNSKGKTEIDLTAYPQGLYILRLGGETIKLVKQ